MFVRRFVGSAFVLLLAVALLAAGWMVGYQSGWTQGLTAQQMMSECAEGVTAPLALQYAGPPVNVGSILTVLGVLAGIFLFIMLIGMAAKMLMFRAWMRTAGGPDAEFWARWHHHGHDHISPWRQHWVKPCGPAPKEPDSKDQAPSEDTGMS